MEMVDVELLAKAIAWAADAPNARNRTFNVANGDTYIWPDLWPVIASEIGIAPGGQEAMSVRAYIDSNAARWADIVRRNDLDIPEDPADFLRSEEHTSELQSLMRISYAVFCLKKKK